MVWTVALFFFQGALLAGYFLVHKIFAGSVTRVKGLLYFLLVAIGVWASRFDPATLSTGPTSLGFALSELKLLMLTIGIPFLALSTTSVALQRWWQVDTSKTGEEPYYLYGASNLGSFAGLLSYPFVFEPMFSAEKIWHGWHLAIVFWALIMLACFPKNPAREISLEDESNPVKDKPEFSPLKWIIPAAGSSALLAAVTNVITIDVAAFPFLWVLPLAIYLLSWVRIFRKNPPNLSWWSDHASTIMAFAFFMAILIQFQFSLDAIIKTIALLAILYSCSIMSQASLLGRRPVNSQQLTSFYLYVSFGGFLGTALIAFGIPVLFDSLAELPIALTLVAWGISGISPWKIDKSDTFLLVRVIGVILIVFLIPLLALRFISALPSLIITASAGCAIYVFSVLSQTQRLGRNFSLIVMLIAASLVFADELSSDGVEKTRFRNFYGLYQVFEKANIRYLQMGTTYHGHEIIDGPNKGKPTFYYHPDATIGKFMTSSAMKAKNIAVLGLGAGVMAAFLEKGQTLDFYELDPDNIWLAQKHFSYLEKTKGKVNIICGDGRLQMRNATQTYDLIFMDAFSSDSIPIHLLTIEAIQEYMKRLNNDGCLLFHISNRHLDLLPILTMAAKKLGLIGKVALNYEDEKNNIYPTRWFSISTPEGYDKYLKPIPSWKDPILKKASRYWTDDFSSMLDAFPPDPDLFTKPPEIKPEQNAEKF